MLRIVSSLSLACLAASETFIAASDPRVQYSGRTQINADGSRTFDWEAVSFSLRVAGTSYIKAVITTQGGRTRFITDEPTSNINGTSNGFVIGSFYVDPVAANMTNSTFYAGAGLDPSSTYTIRIFNDLEPEFHGPVCYGKSGFTFMGFIIDGTALTVPAPYARSMEWVGDSLTAGFGSRGTNPPCQTNQYSSSNYYSYTRYICDTLQANCSIIAWSGKGVFENCCNDKGETMPSYFLQTMGQETFTQDWDFTRFVPSALAINLGTNDEGNNNGTAAWTEAFQNTYINFVTNAVNNLYKSPKMPVLLVQGPFNSSALWSSLQYIQSSLQASGVNAHYVSAIIPDNPDGCQGHPGQKAHPLMAAVALPQIQQILGWN